MIKVYHGTNIDAIKWKIYQDNINKSVKYFSTNTSSSEIASQLCQCSLFSDESFDLYVANIEKWKLTDKQVISNIKELHSLPNLIILFIDSGVVKNKIFNDLDIEKIKCTSITKKSKYSVVDKMLTDQNIVLRAEVKDFLINILPENINFIKNEILKLKLSDKKSFTIDDIKEIVLDLGDATVFNIVDSWLSNDKSQTIERLNDLLSKNISINVFIPIFALKLMQIKLFLTAKLLQWPPEIITAKQSIPFWQQANYSKLRPYDSNLKRIDTMLNNLYQFDINVKKQRNIPYTKLIKILFE